MVAIAAFATIFFSGSPLPQASRNQLRVQVSSEARPIDAAMFRAISTEDVIKLRTLLDKGANCNATGANRLRPLLLAARAQTRGFEMVKLLLERGAEVNYIQSIQGYTALKMAIGPDCDAKLVKLLLDRGAKVDLPIFGGKCALAFAVESGQPEIVRLLLAKGANVSARTVRGYELLVGAEHSFEPSFEAGGQPPIFGLAQVWSPEIFDILVKAGADPHAVDGNRWDLLDYAVWNGNNDAVAALIAKGWDVNRGSRQGFTPLHIAMRSLGSFPEQSIVEMLLTAKADPRISNYIGQTPADLLRSDIKFHLKAESGAVVGPGWKPYVDLCEIVLRELSSAWRDLEFFAVKGKCRVLEGASSTVLEIRLGPSTQKVKFTLYYVFLDNYSPNDVVPITIVLDKNESRDLRIKFPSAAGKHGCLAYKFSVRGIDALVKEDGELFEGEPKDPTPLKIDITLDSSAMQAWA